MIYWLERSESRYLDILTSMATSLYENYEKNGRPINKYELINMTGSLSKLFSNVPISVLESQISNFSSLSDGRYIREFAYVLCNLNFAEENVNSKINSIEINNIKEIGLKFKPFIQISDTQYVPTLESEKLSKTIYGSENWQNLLKNSILSYGYFNHYLDCLIILQKLNFKYNNKKIIHVSQIKNIIGPIDHTVKGSGPDFVQETFKTWAFFMNIINIHTPKLNNYSNDLRLDYLCKHTGYITDGNSAYNILRGLTKFNTTFNNPTIFDNSEFEINVVSFMRFSNIKIWQNNYSYALFTSLLRTRLIYIANNYYNIKVSIKKYSEDLKVSELKNEFNCEANILKELLFLESNGLLFEVEYDHQVFYSITELLLEKFLCENTSLDDLKRINRTSLFFDNIDVLINKCGSEIYLTSKRRINVIKFEKSFPKGGLIKWLQKI